YQTVINAELNHKSFAFNVPFIDDASIQNCFTCCVAMVFLEYSNEIINERIKQLSHLHMRLQLQNAINNCVIVNDTYTNDFTAFIRGVDFLQQNKGVKKSTIILSDFIESSFNKDQLYSQLTSILQANAIDTFIGIGNQMVANNHSLQQACKEVFLFENVDEFLKSRLHQQFKNQIIYIKGARVFGLEKIVNQLQQKNHQTQLQINFFALQHNLKVIKQTIAPTTQIMGMVKAFGYGSGSEEVAKLLQFNNLDYLAVAYTDEGIALRKSGISLPIMVMNIDADNFYDLVEYNLEPEIFSFSLLHQFIQFLNQQGLHQYPIHVKVNTGMNRLGFEVIDSEQIGITLSSSTLVKIKSVFTHLASSDDSTHDDYTLYQQQQFDEFCNTLKQQINYTFLQHAANTAAIIRHAQ
ncbi:MAG: alanine racemase, partial [Chitinophagaceae bacterium]